MEHAHAKPIPGLTLIMLLVSLLTTTITQSQTLSLPPRNPYARPASQLIEAWKSLNRADRESRIWEEISSGNVPAFLRQLSEIHDTVVIRGKEQYIRYYCTPDYLAVGSNEDYLLVPMSAYLAQRLANETQTNLPTAKLVDHIYESARVKLRPQPIPPSPEMTTLPVFVQHQQMIQDQRDSLHIAISSQPISGHKKDIILSNKIYRELKSSVPNPVVIYGWHKLNGNPIQPVYNGHGATYADYSHGVRLVQDQVWVNDKARSMRRLLASRRWSVLLSDEGRIRRCAYPESFP